MKELNLEDFPDELCQVEFSFTEACEHVGVQKLERESTLIPKIEDKISFPYFALYVWGFIFSHKRIPTQKEFYEGYYDEQSVWLAQQNFDEQEHDGVKGRMYRAYTSLLRDCLFALQLREELATHGVEVRFNRCLDTNEGIDILLLHNGKKYGLNLYLNSKRSLKYREAKTGYRHKEFDDVEMTDVPCPWRGRWSCGDIWMYGITDLNIVKDALGIEYEVLSSSMNGSWEDF